MRTLITIGLIAAALFTSFARPAHALDKRLKLTFKTAAYGAGAGLVIGAGTAALGMGGIKNAFMGASAGMYAGILFAGYLIFTHESPKERAMQRSRNPYGPRRPIDGDDWRDMDEEEYQNFLPPEEAPPSEGAALNGGSNVACLGGGTAFQSETPLIWSPIVTLEF